MRLKVSLFGRKRNDYVTGSRGRGDGNDVTQVNTHVDAGNKLTIASGTDTTLKGAVVSGKQVVMDVGTSGSGNLNIESLQDTSTYKSNQQSAGVSVSAGAGKVSGSLNVARSSVDGDTQHGTFERVNPKSGQHVGEVDMGLALIKDSKDASGKHDLKVK